MPSKQRKKVRSSSSKECNKQIKDAFQEIKEEGEVSDMLPACAKQHV